jgi:hypothetical protein
VDTNPTFLGLRARYAIRARPLLTLGETHDLGRLPSAGTVCRSSFHSLTSRAVARPSRLAESSEWVQEQEGERNRQREARGDTQLSRQRLQVRVRSNGLA